MAAATETTDGRYLINDDSQDYGSSVVNCPSQGSANRQFEANWFSPSLTSTQMVSFDLINSQDDSQDVFLLTHGKENLFEDVSLEEIPCSADLSCLLTSSDHTVVCETPPPQGKSVNEDIIITSNYLFKSTRLSSIKCVNVTPSPTMQVSKKRQSTQKKNKPYPMKKVKLEGYSCKLNGAVYHVMNRDLDVLEAIEKALNCIQQAIRQQGMCSVRHLCLQLNQVETIIGFLDDEQLGLGMSLEAWNEVMVHTKQMFHDTQNEVDAVRRRRLELDTSTDELTYSFSQSFSISGTNQGLPKKQHTSANVKNQNSAKSSHFQSKPLKTSEPVHAGQSENEGQARQIPNTVTYNEGVLLQTSSFQTTGRNELLTGSKKNRKKQSADISHSPITLGSIRRSTSKREKYLQSATTENSIRLSSGLLGLASDQDFVPTPASTPCASRKTLAIGESNSNTQAGDCLEELSEATVSTTHANDSIPTSNSILGNVKPSNSTPNCYRVSPATSNCLLQIEKEIARADNRAVDVQEESFIIGGPPSSSQSSFLWNTSRTPEIVKMSFHLRPFILKGVLCPGKNNMKLGINSRIYVGSLAADGTIEMNGFNFPSIGSWIKSVEGKLFTKLSKSVQKTLDLQYKGKSLTQLIEVNEQSESSFPGKNHEILSYNDTNPYSMPHPTTSECNFIQERNQSPNPAIQNPMPYIVGAGSNPVWLSATIPNVASNSKEELQFVPEEMTRHIKTIFLHAQDEYFPICKCAEQFWCGLQPFPEHILEEVDSWK